jgi:hypothetical protein
MTDTFVYMLSNESTGLNSTHETLNDALNAVKHNVGNRDTWIVQESARGRPQILRWVAEGRGHARADDDVPMRDRRRSAGNFEWRATV